VTSREFLGVLSKAGISLALDGDALLVKGAKGRLDQGITAYLIAHKAELVGLLKSGIRLDGHETVLVPPNMIEPGNTTITPQMLPLIDLEQADIDHIVAHTAGGVSNIEDIYQLTALQDGILFHHRLAGEGDPYLLSSIMSFPERATLERFLGAVQKVIARHDILRTAFFWEGLSRPAQVVCRAAQLPVLDVQLDPQDGAIDAQLLEHFGPRRRRIDLTRAPLLSYIVAQDPADGRWIALQLFHHLIGDHSTFALLREEVFALCAGQEHALKPAEPYRNLVAQARLGRSQQEHEAFFRAALGDIDEPTLAFGLTDVHQQGGNIDDAHLRFSADLNQRLRVQARRLGVSLASLCHLAWGQVLARSVGASRVMFGTVLLGRMQARERGNQAAGLFINTLPFRVDLDDTRVDATVRLTHARLAELFEHEHAPLALAQRCSGVAPGSPLFNAILNYRHGVELSSEVPAAASGHPLAGVALVTSEERSNYPITLSVEDFGHALGVSAQVAQPLSAERMCRYMEQALESLADALEHAPHVPARTLEILPPGERTLLLDTWNATDAPWPREHCIHRLFEEHARRTPQAIAVVHGEQSIDYASLNAQANRLATLLVQRGIGRGDHVATLFERGILLVLAQLAILKAGAIYVPLDPRLVPARRDWILADCGARLLLADAALPAPSAVETLSLHAAEWTRQGLAVPDLELALSSAAAAHVIYTSGSTGTPKGVLVPHSAISNLAIRNGYTAFDATDRMAFVANPAFDASTIEVWGALLNGARLVVVDTDVLIDAARFGQALTRYGITAMLLTTSLFNQHARAIAPALARVKYLMSGGERADPESLRRGLRAGTDCHLLNCYGPAEATVFPLCSRITEADTRTDNLPIGRPIANARAYLLDAQRRPVPLGATGELYIGGAGVALGYLNRPELTAERFLHDPFGAAPDARMYKTGDLARYLPGGQLEFLGRNDDQVKIRGFRIEPGEVAAHLARHAQVREAVVLPTGSGADQRLIAYVIAADDAADGQALATALRQHMATALPDYMLPAAYVRVAAWPLTPNGKFDRKALPAPQDDAFARGAFEEPQGEVEQLIAALWQELLGVARIGRYDNFFELGGHSLLAVELIERLRQHQLKVDVRRLFAAPVLCTLAAGVEREGGETVPPNLIQPGCVAITPEMLPLVDLRQRDIDLIVAQVPGGIANIQDIYALAPLQDGILFHHRLGDEGDPYLLSNQRSFPNRELLDRFLDALQALVDRHDILRTAFMWEGLPVPVQVVLRKAAMPVLELALDPREGAIAEQLARRFDPRRQRMDLTQAPLLHYAVAHDPDNDRWLLLQRFHHLVGDHSTLDLLRGELAALMAGKGGTLPPAPPFRNLVAQARLGRSQEEHEQFFRAMLGDLDEPTLPFDVADVHQAGAGVCETSYLLPESMSDSLRQQARRLGVSVASLCHLAWAQVLARVVDSDRVVFGTVLFGRIQSSEGAARAAGLFINTLPLRIDIGATAVESAVRETHDRLADLLCHEHASLALAQRCSGVAAPAPLFSSVLNYRHNLVLRADTKDADDYRALEQVELLESNERTSYPITLSVDDYGHRLGLTALVVDLLSAERICGYMQQALASLAEALEFAPATPVGALDVLWAQDRPAPAPAIDGAGMRADAPAAHDSDVIGNELEEFRL
jgi:amino acid adenylation domain-containing protein